jgi:hypothetical protein
MDIIMGSRGERFVQFLKQKRRERRGADDDFDDVQFAKELKVEYETLKRWLKVKSVGRIDLDNFLAVYRVYGQEFMDFLEG